MATTQDISFDEYSDPANPRKIKYDDIVAASRRIVGAVSKTPLLKAHMSEKLGMEVYMKAESMHITGCFKERGVRNALMQLSDDQKKLGTVAATDGNHGIAMSYHTSQLGIPCIVVMPTTSPSNKIDKAQRYGAKVILHGNNMLDAKAHAMIIRRDKRMLYINSYDHPHIIEGQGTIGLEIMEQLPMVDAVMVPVGGGGLITGIAIAIKHLKPETEVYGISTDKTCSMAESLRKNERIYLAIENSIADGLAVSTVGVNSFHNLKGLVDKMVIVKEDWVARAITHLIEDEKLVVEGAGAVTIAAVMAGMFPNLKGKKVVCILSGGNIDTTILSRALERGMAAEGRLLKFKVSIQDRPGGMADLCALLAGIGVTIRDCLPERTWVKGDVFSVQMKVVAETRGWDHTKEMIDQIKKHYKDYYFPDMAERTEKLSNSRRGPCLAPNPVCMQK